MLDDKADVFSCAAFVAESIVSLTVAGSGIESRRAESPRVKAEGCGGALRRGPP